MATLTGSTVASTYKQLLKVTSEGIGADASAKYIEDGLGTDSALSISTTRVGIGTASPANRLYVTTSDSGQWAAVIENTHSTSGYGVKIKAGDSDTESVLLLEDKDATDLFKVSSAGQTYMKGNVGIGTSAPANPLHLASNFVGAMALFHNSGNANNREGITIKCGLDDGSGTNAAIEIRSGNNTLQGQVTFTSGTVTYGAFTANHDIELPSDDNDDGYPYGTLVEHTELFYKQENGSDTERGIQYKAQKSSSAYAKNVLGAYAGKYKFVSAIDAVEAQDATYYEDGDELPDGKNVGDVKTEAVDAVLARESSNENLHQVYVLGDGHILCNGEKGNIAIGDGICTSSTGGQGMKADKMAMCIGIAQGAVTFSGSESKLVAVQYGLQQFTPWE